MHCSEIYNFFYCSQCLCIVRKKKTCVADILLPGGKNSDFELPSSKKIKKSKQLRSVDLI